MESEENVVAALRLFELRRTRYGYFLITEPRSGDNQHYSLFFILYSGEAAPSSLSTLHSELCGEAAQFTHT
ncbi:MAG: hypothetical protein ACI4RP_00585 [Acutalibacteraceae bacterium]